LVRILDPYLADAQFLDRNFGNAFGKDHGVDAHARHHAALQVGGGDRLRGGMQFRGG
jgi:hypothetical protein